MAQVDCFLKIEGIEGESQDKTHPKEIEISSWSWGETQPGSFAVGGGGGAGKVQMQDLNFTKLVDKSSPNLMHACASGKHIKSAVLCCRKAGGKQEDFLKITLSDVLISSFQTGGSQGENIPVDQVSINFAKIEYGYAPQNSKGGLDGMATATWDQKLGDGRKAA